MAPQFLILGVGAAVFALSLSTCFDTRSANPPVVAQTQVEGKAFLLNAKDFDLAAVVELIKNNKLSDAASLEKMVNAPGNAINHVDLDGNKEIDYLSVKESRNADNMTLDFISHDQTVASVRFVQNASNKQVDIQGAYAGHSFMPFGHGIGIGEALFLGWLFSPGRALYQPPLAVHQRQGFMRPFFRQNNGSTYNKATKPSGGGFKMRSMRGFRRR